ncbi:hypothetical protein N657DRAFT_156888 [Parathielavia appendiculata]|uniref:Secreted protein n=1 Tax=Parathielavia appendiculata TaxID=2587402 RepID=A0AAN6TTN7_9PEZI|nr:hypothetical protein N657DRAFT_156888 [Parathielavia appendiculata]
MSDTFSAFLFGASFLVNTVGLSWETPFASVAPVVVSADARSRTERLGAGSPAGFPSGTDFRFSGIIDLVSTDFGVAFQTIREVLEVEVATVWSQTGIAWMSLGAKIDSSSTLIRRRLQNHSSRRDLV